MKDLALRRAASLHEEPPLLMSPTWMMKAGFWRLMSLKRAVTRGRSERA